MKKMMALVSAAALVCGLFAGCSNQPNGGKPSETGLGLAAPYYGDGLVIASLEQLWEEGVIEDGASLIGDADAVLGEDIILSNGKIAVTVAVSTPDPWGYPVGSIVDLASVSGVPDADLLSAFRDGTATVGNDRLWDVRLLMNSWDTWGPGNCGDMTFEVVKDYEIEAGKDPVTALKVAYSYGEKSPTDTQDFETPLAVTTYYAMGEKDDYLTIKTVLENNGDLTYVDRATGYSLSSKSTSVFSPGVDFYDPDPMKAVNDFTTAYNPEYTLGLIVPGIEDAYTSTGYSDTYSMFSYEPGTTTEIIGYLRLDDGTTDISNVMAQLLDTKGVPVEDRLEIRGTVVDDTGKNVAGASVVIEKNCGDSWKPLTWCTADADGAYSLVIPKAGNISDYRVYGAAENYAITPDSARLVLKGDIDGSDTMPACQAEPLVLSRAVELDVTLKDQNGAPVDGKIQLAGVNRCAIDYIANNVFFTDLDNVGHAKVLVYPGEYELRASSGGDFFSKYVTVKGNTSGDTTLEITVDRVEDLRPQGWYNVDMHHHVNKSDACTKPVNFVKSTMAEGLTVLLSSDHDNTEANHEISKIVADSGRDIIHIPSVEISASWAHFNAIPTDAAGRDYMNDISNGVYKFDQYALFPDMVGAVHEKDMIFMANHPWIGYGLFNAQAIDAVPGGYDDEFDLIEINSGCSDKSNVKAMESARTLWTESLSGGKVYYLGAGSDTHDVLDT